MSLLPPSTNHPYRGSLASVWFLGLYGLLEFGTGCVHYCLPDGGAGTGCVLDDGNERQRQSQILIEELASFMGAGHPGL